MPPKKYQTDEQKKKAAAERQRLRRYELDNTLFFRLRTSNISFNMNVYDFLGKTKPMSKRRWKRRPI